MAPPQFGEPKPGLDHRDRAAAFAVIERNGLIALVDVAQKGRGLDLPGGGLDPGESAVDAAVRESAEEAGLEIEVEAEPFALADQVNVNPFGPPLNTRGSFFRGRVLAETPSLKIEDDHTLVWMTPEDALVRLHRDSHAWALAVWLRLRAGA